MEEKVDNTEERQANKYVPSLKKIAAIAYCGPLNNRYPQPDPHVVETLSPLADEVLNLLTPFLHYRWVRLLPLMTIPNSLLWKINAIISKKPSLESTAAPFLSAGMRREEDFHRKKDPPINIPLIQVYDETETFKTREFADNDRICLEEQSPFALEDEFEFLGELR